jgi:hypothetical protein
VIAFRGQARPGHTAKVETDVSLPATVADERRGQRQLWRRWIRESCHQQREVAIQIGK